MDYTLYFCPGSYYSNKVLLALYENDVPFKQKVVNIFKRENHESWFEKLNPKKEVPVLKCGNDVIADSDDIIDYIARRCDTGESSLVPALNTALGQDVAEFREYIQELPIQQITLGLTMNPRLQLKRMRYPEISALTRKSFEKMIDANIEALGQNLQSGSGQAAELEEALNGLRHMKSVVFDEAQVADILDDLDQTFDRIESQLQSSKQGTTKGQFWMFGSTFTAADISTAIFLYRIYEIGMEDRYFSDTKRPIIMDYYRRVGQRPSFQKMASKIDKTRTEIAKARTGISAAKVVKITLVVGVVSLFVLGGREFWLSRRGISRA